MNFKLFGNLTGELCKSCSHPLTHAVVHLYRREVNQDVLTHVVADPKATLSELKPEEIARLKPLLLGSAPTNNKGDYDLRVDGAANKYEGGPVLVVVEIRHLTDLTKNEKPKASVYYAVTTIQPEWQYTRDQSLAVARFDYCFPERWMILLLTYFDLWVVSGYVGICKNPKLPAVGVNVTVMDADLITDDDLGTVTTNGAGRFVLYYHSADFKRTFLSPLINIETLGSAGPDLYYIIRASDGSPLLEETRADGKQVGRRDSPRIVCVSLCVDTGTTVNPAAMIWTGIGQYLRISTEGNPNHFDNDGFAVPDGSVKKHAIYSSVRLTGQKPNPLAPGNPIEFRFLVSNTVSQNHLTALPEANFTQKVSFNNGLMTSVHLGTLVRNAPSPAPKFVDVYLDPTDVDPVEGWVDVRKAVNRTLLAHPLYDPSDLTDPSQIWTWDDADGMIGLNTAKLTNPDNPSFAGLLPGQAVPVGSRYGIEKVAIRFEIRDQVTLAPVLGNGVTLNAMVVNNNSPVIKLAVKNFNGTTVICDKFKNEDVYVAYTAYHPHLEYVNIGVTSVSGAYSSSVIDAPVPFDNNPRPGVDHVNNNSYKISPRPNVTCNYTVSLNWHLLMLTGDGGYYSPPATVPFFYEV